MNSLLISSSFSTNGLLQSYPSPAWGQLRFTTSPVAINNLKIMPQIFLQNNDPNVSRWPLPSSLNSTPDPYFHGDAAVSTNHCSEVEMQMQVQENEIDQCGLVNIAAYLRFCQQGHQQLFKKIGLGAAFAAEKVDQTTTLSDLCLKFFAAFKNGDRFIVRTQLSCISTNSIFVEDFIFSLPNRKLILEAEATIVLIDKNCQPLRISPGVKANILMLDRFDNYD